VNGAQNGSVSPYGDYEVHLLTLHLRDCCALPADLQSKVLIHEYRDALILALDLIDEHLRQPN
jgi:hypothetical protein